MQSACQALLQPPCCQAVAALEMQPALQEALVLGHADLDIPLCQPAAMQDCSLVRLAHTAVPAECGIASLCEILAHLGTANPRLPPNSAMSCCCSNLEASASTFGLSGAAAT